MLIWNLFSWFGSLKILLYLIVCNFFILFERRQSPGAFFVRFGVSKSKGDLARLRNDRINDLTARLSRKLLQNRRTLIRSHLKISYLI